MGSNYKRIVDKMAELGGSLSGVASTLDRRPRSQVVFFGLAAVLVAGLIDYLTGPQFAPLVLYFVPVVAVAWRAGVREGVLIGSIAALCWLLAEATNGAEYENDLLLVWAALSRLFVFAGTAVLLGATHGRLAHGHGSAVLDAVEPSSSPCPYCGSTDTLELYRNLVCQSCKRVSDLERG